MRVGFWGFGIPGVRASRRGSVGSGASRPSATSSWLGIGDSLTQGSPEATLGQSRLRCLAAFGTHPPKPPNTQFRSAPQTPRSGRCTSQEPPRQNYGQLPGTYAGESQSVLVVRSAAYSASLCNRLVVP